MCACTAVCAPSAVLPLRGICRSPMCTGRWRSMRRALRSAQAQDRLSAAKCPQASDERTSLMSAPESAKINDFVIKIATVNGTGSASANMLLMKSIFRSGIPVMGKNYFPSNIQGLPTWYEIRVTKDGYVACSGRVDIMVAMNAETYSRDVREVVPGRLSRLRLDLAAPGASEKRGHHRHRRAACEAVQRELQRRAHAHPDEEHLLRRSSGRASGSGHRADQKAPGGDRTRRSRSSSRAT
jgi:hypothetical protein